MNKIQVKQRKFKFSIFNWINENTKMAGNGKIKRALKISKPFL